MALPVKAFLFDLNGTMIDDMHYHNKAWFHILNDDLGANMTWDEVKFHMYGKNTELLIRVFGKDRFSLEEMNGKDLTAETVQGAALAFEGINDIKGSDGLALGMLSVGDGITDDVFEENLQYTSGLFID